MLKSIHKLKLNFWRLYQRKKNVLSCPFMYLWRCRGEGTIKICSLTMLPITTAGFVSTIKHPLFKFCLFFSKQSYINASFLLNLFPRCFIEETILDICVNTNTYQSLYFLNYKISQSPNYHKKVKNGTI